MLSLLPNDVYFFLRLKDSLVVEKAAENSESIINIEAEVERASPEMKQDLLDFISLEEEDDESSDYESEVEKQEKTKQGSLSVLNAQKMPCLMEEAEQNL
ncbi:hypothetical protein Bca52824_034222 [Brassica carinata]|uniref:Uncharacterized protein n=1 Tax=Brassica carinata TaxID=52824 RepID=A0A8X7V9V2_BRACI|nr:hypothetical protein Bca52824_034222 [Brassica carinata]